MCKLSFGTTINFANLVNNSFEHQPVMDEQTKKVLQKPDLPIFVRQSLESTFGQNRVLTGIESLYASLGRFDLMPHPISEFVPVNVRYDFDPRMLGLVLKIVNRYSIDSANFLMAYLQWRTGESITDCEWKVSEIWEGLNYIHKLDEFLTVTKV